MTRILIKNYFPRKADEFEMIFYENIDINCYSVKLWRYLILFDKSYGSLKNTKIKISKIFHYFNFKNSHTLIEIS